MALKFDDKICERLENGDLKKLGNLKSVIEKHGPKFFYADRDVDVLDIKAVECPNEFRVQIDYDIKKEPWGNYAEIFVLDKDCNFLGIICCGWKYRSLFMS